MVESFRADSGSQSSSDGVTVLYVVGFVTLKGEGEPFGERSMAWAVHNAPHPETTPIHSLSQPEGTHYPKSWSPIVPHKILGII